LKDFEFWKNENPKSFAPKHLQLLRLGIFTENLKMRFSICIFLEMENTFGDIEKNINFGDPNEKVTKYDQENVKNIFVDRVSKLQFIKHYCHPEEAKKSDEYYIAGDTEKVQLEGIFCKYAVF